MATASDPLKKPSADAGGSAQSSLAGLRFNQTGREETAREVLKPQRDAASTKRMITILVLMVVGLAALGALTVQRSNLKWRDVFGSDENKPQFAPPQAGGD